MKRFERETGKKAIWQGRVTESFKKWKAGKTIYTRNKERIGIYVESETKDFWQELADKMGNKSVSQLIRDAIDHYSECGAVRGPSVSQKLVHEIKNKLTPLKGSAIMLLNNPRVQLDSEMRNRVQGIIDKVIEIDKRLMEEYKRMVSDVDSNNILEMKKKLELDEDKPCDILIVDDDADTREFLVEYLQFKKYKCMVLKDGMNIIEKLDIIQPRVLLLDILLPNKNGVEICNEIRENENYKDLPIYFITAVPDVKKYMKKADANGYFPKPFEVNDLEKLKQHVPDYFLETDI